MAQLLFQSRDEENAVAVQLPIGIVAFVVPRDLQDTKSSDPTFLKVSLLHVLTTLSSPAAGGMQAVLSNATAKWSPRAAL